MIEVNTRFLPERDTYCKVSLLGVRPLLVMEVSSFLGTTIIIVFPGKAWALTAP